MAFDTDNERLAILGDWLEFLMIPPLDEGMLSVEDRLHLLGGPSVTITIVLIPVHTVTIPARQVAVTIPAHTVSVTIFAETVQVTIPARTMAISVGRTLVADTLTKQPSERIPLRMTFQDVPDGAEIVSGTAFASDVTAGMTDSTTMTDPANAGAATINLLDNPGIGARLTIGAGGTAEVQKVSNISGSGPYAATINPGLFFDHPDNEPVVFEQGVSVMFIVDPAVDPVPPNATDIEVRHGAHGHTYRLSEIVTLGTGAILEGEVNYVVSDT